MDPSIEVLLSEKQELERALADVRELLEKSEDEKLQIHKLYTDWKSRCELVITERSQY